MSQELHYTSLSRGLKPGSRGFCTVACTASLTPKLAERLEALSGYRRVFPPHHARAAENPVAWSHLLLRVAGNPYHVVSRVAAAGLDYSERSNKYAHHIALEPAECLSAGPGWLMRQPGYLDSTWSGEPRILPGGRPSPRGDREPSVCTAWQQVTGDAGWAGVVAQAFLDDPKRPVYLVYEPGADLLPLIDEALALLPPTRRWEVTFSTYFTGLPPEIQCQWRGVLSGSVEARQARRYPGALMLDLSTPLGAAPDGPLTDAARTGRISFASQIPTHAASAAELLRTDLAYIASAVPPVEPDPSQRDTTPDERASIRVIPGLSLDHRPNQRSYQNKHDSLAQQRRRNRSLLVGAFLAASVLLVSGSLVWLKVWPGSRTKPIPSPRTSNPLVVSADSARNAVGSAKTPIESPLDTYTQDPINQGAPTVAVIPTPRAESGIVQPDFSEVQEVPGNTRTAQGIGVEQVAVRPAQRFLAIDLDAGENLSQVGQSKLNDKEKNQRILLGSNVEKLRILGISDPDLKMYDFEFEEDKNADGIYCLSGFMFGAKADSERDKIAIFEKDGREVSVKWANEEKTNKLLKTVVKDCLLKAELSDGGVAIIALRPIPVLMPPMVLGRLARTLEADDPGAAKRDSEEVVSLGSNGQFSRSSKPFRIAKATLYAKGKPLCGLSSSNSRGSEFSAEIGGVEVQLSLNGPDEGEDQKPLSLKLRISPDPSEILADYGRLKKIESLVSDADEAVALISQNRPLLNGSVRKWKQSVFDLKDKSMKSNFLIDFRGNNERSPYPEDLIAKAAEGFRGFIDIARPVLDSEIDGLAIQAKLVDQLNLLAKAEMRVELIRTIDGSEVVYYVLGPP